MAKTIEEFLKPTRTLNPPHVSYQLTDIVNRNPTIYCPNCESKNIERLRTHNCDGMDYKCNTCNLTYDINLCRD